MPATKPCQAGQTHCGQPARLFPCGWRCDSHKPAGDPYRNQKAGAR